MLFDPATITQKTLDVKVNGYLAETGPPGDRFVIREDFTVASDENLLWDTGAGWTDNFMQGTLLLGTSGAYVQLVDASDNSATCLSGYCVIWSSEALYVDNLILEAGTTLDLGGLNLCVLEGYSNYGGTRLTGIVTVASAVPLPAAVYLFGSGHLRAGIDVRLPGK